MPNDLVKLFCLLTRRERRLAATVIITMMAAAGLQALTAGSFYPFLSAVSDPSALKSGWLGWAYAAFGFSNENHFLVAAGIAVMVLVIISNGGLAFAHWIRLRFQWGINHTLSVRLLEAYLNREYIAFLTENTAELNKNILTEAREISDGLVKPVLSMVSSGSLAAAMIVLLLIVDPLATLIVLTVAGGGYALAYQVIRHRLQVLGTKYAEANHQRYKVTAEAFGGIKALKILGREGYFVQEFAPASRIYTSALAARNVYAQLPKYVIEALAIGSLLGVLLLLIVSGRSTSLVVPIMGTFAFAGYRMMPAFRDILSAMAAFRFTEDIFGRIEEALGEPRIPQVRSEEALEPSDGVQLRSEIVLDNVTYFYPTASRPGVRDVSVVILAGSTVGIVGRTGAGKTTLVDILLGLLAPSYGRLLVDGAEIKGRQILRWQRSCGYVPQQIYLADSTIRQNIAFAVPGDRIDDDAVSEAAKAADLLDFVEALPAGFNTVIGERGVRLSGGQRQRIGIARALYHKPAILILDEATSELDCGSESAIARSISALEWHQTTIVIAHRLSTVEDADLVVLLADGCIVDRGTYKELLSRNGDFRVLAGGSSSKEHRAQAKSY